MKAFLGILLFLAPLTDNFCFFEAYPESKKFLFLLMLISSIFVWRACRVGDFKRSASLAFIISFLWCLPFFYSWLFISFPSLETATLYVVLLLLKLFIVLFCCLYLFSIKDVASWFFRFKVTGALVFSVLSLGIFIGASDVSHAYYGFFRPEIFGGLEFYPRIRFLFAEPSKYAQYLILPISIVFLSTKEGYSRSLILGIFLSVIALTQAFTVIFAGVLVLFLYFVRTRLSSVDRSQFIAHVSFLGSYCLVCLYLAFVIYPAKLKIYSKQASFEFRVEELRLLWGHLKYSLRHWLAGDIEGYISKGISFPNPILEFAMSAGVLGVATVGIGLLVILSLSRISHWAYFLLWGLLSSLTYGPLHQRLNLILLSLLLIDLQNKNFLKRPKALFFDTFI